MRFYCLPSDKDVEKSAKVILRKDNILSFNPGSAIIINGEMGNYPTDADRTTDVDIYLQKDDVLGKNRGRVTTRRVGSQVQSTFIRNPSDHLTRYERINRDEYRILDRNGKELGRERYDNSCRYKKAVNVKKSLRNLRMILKGNFENDERDLFITLTYAESNMVDYHRLSKNLDSMMGALQYRYRDEYNFEYVRIAEPTEAGDLHTHICLRDKAHKKIRRTESFANSVDRCWGLGSVNVQQIYNINKLADYLTDNIAKTGRISLYPKGMRVFTTTKGIDKVAVTNEKMTCDEMLNTAKSEKGKINVQKIYSNDEEERVINCIITAEWEEDTPIMISNFEGNEEDTERKLIALNRIIHECFSGTIGAQVRLSYKKCEDRYNVINYDVIHFIDELNKKYPDNSFEYLFFIYSDGLGRFKVYVLIKDSRGRNTILDADTVKACWRNGDAYYINEPIIVPRDVRITRKSDAYLKMNPPTELADVISQIPREYNRVETKLWRIPTHPRGIRIYRTSRRLRQSN